MAQTLVRFGRRFMSKCKYMSLLLLVSYFSMPCLVNCVSAAADLSKDSSGAATVTAGI